MHQHSGYIQHIRPDSACALFLVASMAISSTTCCLSTKLASTHTASAALSTSHRHSSSCLFCSASSRTCSFSALHWQCSLAFMSIMLLSSSLIALSSGITAWAQSCWAMGIVYCWVADMTIQNQEWMGKECPCHRLISIFISRSDNKFHTQHCSRFQPHEFGLKRGILSRLFPVSPGHATRGHVNPGPHPLNWTIAIMVASYLSSSYLISMSILSNHGTHLISYLIYGCGLVSS